jgi:hypothetical protein
MTIEQMIVNVVGTLAFGGGGIVTIALIYRYQFNKLLDSHCVQIDRICNSHEETVNRNATAFEKAITNRDEQLKQIIDFAMQHKL